MMKFIECDHPRKEGDLFGLRDDLHTVLSYAEGVFYGLMSVIYQGDRVLIIGSGENLAALGRELCQEARRQVDLLYEAGKLWKDQAKQATGQAGKEG